MSMTKTPNMIVGASVVLDFGAMWRDFRADEIGAAHEKAKQANKHYYGRSGVVVDYDREEAKILVRMDDDHTTDWHYRGHARIESLPKSETDSILREILKAIQSLKLCNENDSRRT